MKQRLPKPSQPTRLSWSGLFAFLLLSLLAAILVVVVLLQHHIRHLETSYYESLMLQKQLDEEWGRLMLEKTHLSSPSRVERVAREQLNMGVPIEAQVIIIEPSSTQPEGAN